MGPGFPWLSLAAEVGLAAESLQLLIDKELLTGWGIQIPSNFSGSRKSIVESGLRFVGLS